MAKLDPADTTNSGGAEAMAARMAPVAPLAKAKVNVKAAIKGKPKAKAKTA